MAALSCWDYLHKRLGLRRPSRLDAALAYAHGRDRRRESSYKRVARILLAGSARKARHGRLAIVGGDDAMDRLDDVGRAISAQYSGYDEPHRLMHIPSDARVAIVGQSRKWADEAGGTYGREKSGPERQSDVGCSIGAEKYLLHAKSPTKFRVALEPPRKVPFGKSRLKHPERTGYC